MILRTVSLLVLASALAAGSASAEGRGAPSAWMRRQGVTIAGTVVDSRSLRPISGAQVIVVGTQQGGLTDSKGQFRLSISATFPLKLQVEMLGYRTLTRTLAAASSSLELHLEPQPLALEGLVVTGTAGAAKEREIGNSVGEITSSQLNVPVPTVDAVLQGNVAGVDVTDQTGQVGGGAAIRLRGNVSASLSNQPVIYVDGVRVRSEGLPKNTSVTGSRYFGPNTSYSPLGDIDPSDIERIEIIRGPAATTLYGTEAAAGVIQIITKQGASGKAKWTMQLGGGFAHLLPFGPTQGQRGEPLITPAGHPNPRYMYLDPFLRNRAWQSNYDLSVSGGVDRARYYVSGSYTNNEGVLPNDLERKLQLRGNVEFEPLKQLQMHWNTSYSRNDLSQTVAGTSAESIFLNAIRYNQNYVGSTNPVVLDSLLHRTDDQIIGDLITGLTATYNPTDHITQRLTIGYEDLEQDAWSIEPYGYIIAPLGVVHENRLTNTITTLDYVGNYRIDLSKALTSTFSLGGQSIRNTQRTIDAYGQDLPGPGGIPTVTSTASTLGFSGSLSVVNAGFFLQNIFALRNRYFVTLGVRADGNSSFGANLGLQAYPKISASYVVSDEPFWHQNWGTLKLRAAWGQAGRAPGAFDATRTWNPVGWGTSPAIRPLNLGNPDLKPERTGEIELGFDAGLLDQRLSASFTYYHQKTTDALFPVQQAPSNGFSGSQLENVGALMNQGIELSVSGIPFRGRSWDVQLGGSLSTNHSKVLSLGGAPSFSVSASGLAVIKKGLPVPALVGYCVTNPNAIADPIVKPNCYYGPNLPTRTIDGWADVRVFQNIELRARGEYQGGAWAPSYGEDTAFPRGIQWPSCFNAYAMISAGKADQLTALERARCIQANAKPDYGIYPMDFFKLREVSVTAPLPVRMPGASSASLTLSARNTLEWRKAKDSMGEPETTGNFEGLNAGLRNPVHTVGGSIPPPALYMLTVRVTF